jgi:guanylate kinase
MKMPPWRWPRSISFDFVIINELFDRALFDLKAIVHSQRLKFAAQRRARAETFNSALNNP